MATRVIIEDFSWYTDKERVKDLKNSSDSLKWKTHVESLKETVKEINKKLCAEAYYEAFKQPDGKKNIAAGMLFEDFDRLETKMTNLHNTEIEYFNTHLLIWISAATIPPFIHV